MEQMQLVENFKFEVGQIHRLEESPTALKVVGVDKESIELLRKDGWRMIAIKPRIYESVVICKQYIQWACCLYGRFTKETWCAE